MAKFDSKSFNPQAFGAYVNRIPNVAKNELAKSGAVGSNEQARAALGNQTGSLYARIPYFGRIDGSTSQNNDGATDIASTNTTTYEQGFIVASRMDSWTERSFSKNITAGVDFMDNVAAQIADYKFDVRQAMLLAILEGVYGMSVEGDTVAATAAKEFIEKHTFDISGEADDAAMVGSTTLNKAIQKACGDNKNIFKLVIMHSEVATNLENIKLLKYMTQTDADGIERELALATWNGRTVLIDDNMPVDSGKYTTYVLGQGAIILDDIGDAVPYEMSRDPKTNGGQDTLYVRDRYICGVDGISFEKPATITASASNEDLANGANWTIINDGTKAIPHKAIAIAKIVSKG
ncbi:MAG: phage coat protein [Clostridia bacterium]|nr:phage coat protein [Clostridia bacterium]